MGRAWLSFGLVVLVGAAVPLACGQKFELQGSAGTGGTSTMAGDPTTSSSAGGAPVTSTTTSTTTSSGAGGCMVDADCKMPRTVCGDPWCVNGLCGYKKTQEDGSTKSQVYGDCHDLKCKNGLLLDEENNNDVYDDANACTEDLCEKGVPTNKPVSAGEACTKGGTVCDGQGACVACTSNTDCVFPADCRNSYCVPPTCYDMTLTPVAGETDIDCGGSACAPCVDGKKCLAETDCMSGVCALPPGQATLRCISSCTDQVKNGTETAKDCGGPDCVARCAAGEGCTVPGDCKSGVCVIGKCIAPSCKDGVKNSNETGVDCGANCPPCP